MRACPAGLPVKAHALVVAAGFQHPALAVALSSIRGDAKEPPLDMEGEFMVEWNEVRCRACKGAMRYDASICPHCRTKATSAELSTRKTEHRGALLLTGAFVLGAVFYVARCSNEAERTPKAEYASNLIVCVESGKGPDSASCSLARQSEFATPACHALISEGSKYSRNGFPRNRFRECEAELPEMTTELSKWSFDS